MRNFKRKLSALALTALFASMQVSYAVIDTGLGGGNGGAVINNATGGFVNGAAGNGSYDLNFNGNSHVNWDSLNVNKGESLNFNAVGGANDLTILNTVNQGMSKIYGQVNANSGIGKLIISNPNGVLFDGAKFTTAGDLQLTTKDLSNVRVEDLGNLNLDNAKFKQIYNDEGKLVGITIQNNSEFHVGGEYNIVAPLINVIDSSINTKTLKMVTSNGQDYVALGTSDGKQKAGVNLKAVTIDGDVYITTPGAGVVQTYNGGTINGNLNVNSKDSVVLNYNHNGEKLTVNGDVTTNSAGSMTFLRKADVKGNLSMSSSGGFVDVGDATVGKNATLTTVGTGDMNNTKYNHFVHVIGDTKVGGNLNIDSAQNIHIGGYDYDAKKLADGNLTVGGDLNAHAHGGHVMTTIDTSANKISLKSDTLNVLTDGKATLSANEYEFSANGYIGGLNSTGSYTINGKTINLPDGKYSVDDLAVDVMENYRHVDSLSSPTNLNIAGGTITKIDTPANAYIASKGDVKLTGANAKEVHITAPNKYIEITGPDVHAENIVVGKETDKLKVDFPSRDYTLKYTNIRDAKEVTIQGTDEITYELTNGPQGYNTRDPRPNDTTYLVGPDKPDVPNPPTPDPDPDPTPDPTPDQPTINPDDNENIKVLRSYERPEAVDAVQPYTPVAYAADLDDDDVDTGVRKNVDGSVTVVRAFPMIN